MADSSLLPPSSPDAPRTDPQPGAGTRFIGILPAAGDPSGMEPPRSPQGPHPILYVDSRNGSGPRPIAVAEFALASLYLAGVRHCFVVGPDTRPEIAHHLGDGSDHDMALGYLVQPTPRGLADAVDVAYPWIGDCYSCLALPDAVFSPLSALDLVCRDLLDSAADLVLGVFPAADPGAFGPVRIDGAGNVIALLEQAAGTDLANRWGVAAWSPVFTRYLHERLAAGGPARQASLGAWFNAALGDGLRVRAVMFRDGEFIDAGTPDGARRLTARWSGRATMACAPTGDTAHAATPTAPIDSAPDSAAAQARLGRLAFEEGRLDEALARAWHVTELAPGDADAFALLGRTLAACEHLDEARHAFEAALRLDPAQAAAHRGLGTLFLAAKDIERAELHLQRAIMGDHTHVETLCCFGWLLHDTNRLERAEMIARLAVKVGPSDGSAHHLLGWVLKKLGRDIEARATLERAVELVPGLLVATRPLAELDLHTGDPALAEARVRDALQAAPDDADLHRTLAWVLLNRRKLADAERAARRAIDLEPDRYAVQAQLGWILLERGKPDAAKKLGSQILSHHPDHAEAHLLMGEIDFRRRALDAAEGWLRRALVCEPHFAPALGRLGALLAQLHRPTEAESLLRAALDADPDYAGAYRELAFLLERQGRFLEAERTLLAVIDRWPRDALAWYGLGRLFDNLERDDEAVDALCRAAALDDQLKDARIRLVRLDARGVMAARHAVANFAPDRLHECLAELIDRATGWLSFEEYQRMIDHALVLFPDDELFEAARQYCLAYDSEQTPESLRAEADAFGRRATPRLMARRTAARRPRIAYVGNHLHPELMDGYIGFHDHDRFDISLFGNDDPDRLPHRDPRLRIHRLDEIDLARACADREIDLVIDIVGPYPRASLLKPFLALRDRVAPVQCLWLNTFATTGCAAYDYVITDRTLVRPGEAHWFSERIGYLPHCQWFWTASERMPTPGSLPALANGHITIGSANRGMKLNDAVLTLWADVMARIPDARLRLVGWHTDDWRLRRRILAVFAERGVTPQRIDFLPAFEHDRLPEFYQTVDLTLDTVPFNGGLTTFESLWMGVPVVALAGHRFTARQTEDILGVLDRKQWIAADRAGFVELVARLAGDLGQLAAARAALRPQMRASPLCDGPRFARDLETLFVDMLAGR